MVWLSSPLISRHIVRYMLSVYCCGRAVLKSRKPQPQSLSTVEIWTAEIRGRDIFNHYTATFVLIPLASGVPRGGGLVVNPLPPQPRNFEGPPKSCQTKPDCENFSKLLNLGRQHPKMFGKSIIFREFQSCTQLTLRSFYIIKISLKTIKLKHLCGSC